MQNRLATLHLITAAMVVGAAPATAARARQDPLPQAAPRFEAVQAELFGAGGTLVNAWADFDGDADLDLFVGFNGEPNRLYRQDAGRFQDVAEAVGVADARATRAAAWGDYDGDGDVDLLVGFAPGDASVLRLYRNDAGRFEDVTSAAGLAVDSGAVRQPAWVDYDRDGDLDLFVAFRDGANRLFHNEGGRFTDVAADIGLADARRSVGAVWFDFDHDGDLDVYVGNMDGDANALFRNDGGAFTDIAEPMGLAWGGRAAGESSNGTVRPCAADVDNDGWIDLFMANYGPNGLFLNRGGTRFEDVSRAWGVAIDGRYDSCAFADFDNDGRLDVYVNGTVTGGVVYRDYLLRNTGSSYEDVTPENLLALVADHGVQWTDYDRDGAIDLALTGVRPEGMHLLLRNRLAADDAARAVRVLVLDASGRPAGPGTEIRVFQRDGDLAAGQQNRADAYRLPAGTRVVDSGSGYNSQSVVPEHFGLPRAGPIAVEVALLTAHGRAIARIHDVDPGTFRGRTLVLRVDENGRITASAR